MALLVKDQRGAIIEKKEDKQRAFPSVSRRLIHPMAESTLRTCAVRFLSLRIWILVVKGYQD